MTRHSSRLLGLVLGTLILFTSRAAAQSPTIAFLYDGVNGTGAERLTTGGLDHDRLYFTISYLNIPAGSRVEFWVIDSGNDGQVLADTAPINGNGFLLTSAENDPDNAGNFVNEFTLSEGLQSYYMVVAVLLDEGNGVLDVDFSSALYP